MYQNVCDISSGVELPVLQNGLFFVSERLSGTLRLTCSFMTCVAVGGLDGTAEVRQRKCPPHFHTHIFHISMKDAWRIAVMYLHRSDLTVSVLGVESLRFGESWGRRTRE